MARRRVLYGMALAAAVLFQIFFTGYLSHFVLVLCLALPLLGLALSLPALLTCRVTLRPGAQGVERGQEALWRVEASSPLGLPLSRCTVTLSTRNKLTGARGRRRAVLHGAGGVQSWEERADSSHCGQLECTIGSVRLCDCLGLFALRRKPPAPAGQFVLPLRGEPWAMPPLGDRGRDGSGLRPRPGGGPGEDYDLRPYRDGDPMRAVHWKLSSKKDELVVKETLEPRRAAMVLTFDHFGPPQVMDAILDELDAVSRALLAKGRPHVIQWAEPGTGAVRSHPVAEERDLDACLAHALADPAPAQGRSVLDGPIRVPGDVPVRHFHVRPRGEAQA